MALKIDSVDFKPVTRSFEEFDVTITIKRATLGEKSKRMAQLFADGDSALLTDIAMVEMWLTLIECDIVGPDEKPLFEPGMDFGLFTKNMSAVWQYSPELFCKIHEVVRGVNPQWQPAEETEGNG